jgi:hypothetical protein
MCYRKPDWHCLGLLCIHSIISTIKKDPNGRSFRFSRPEPLLSFQLAPQLSSRGWVDPVANPLLRKSGSAGNQTRDLCICSQDLWPLNHRGCPIFNHLNVFMIYKLRSCSFCKFVPLMSLHFVRSKYHHHHNFTRKTPQFLISSQKEKAARGHQIFEFLSTICNHTNMEALPTYVCARNYFRAIISVASWAVTW